MKKYLWLLLVPTSIFSKVLIITYQCADPLFLELQCKALKAFCQDDYELAVFDDSKRGRHRKMYRYLCERYGAKYYRVDSRIHRRAYQHREPIEPFGIPSVRNTNCVEFSLRKIGRQHDDLLFLMDGDLLPVKPFSIRKMMGNNQLMGIPQGRSANGRSAEYLWIGFVMLDMSSLPAKEKINFNTGIVNGVIVDAGGYMHYYLKEFAEQIRLKKLGHCIIDKDACQILPEFKPLIGWNMEQMHKGVFLHYRGASNWDGSRYDYVAQKKQIFKNFVENSIGKTTY